MSGLTQEALAQVLQAAQIYAQEERERTGSIIALRFTTLGLTAFDEGAVCLRNATLAWGELAHSDDLVRRLATMIRQVAEQPSGNPASAAPEARLAA
ncbi:hypothetical protein [Methylobacterium durans]|uniref:Uncharacterized protein n=1 Tax=Methylobacterium durans TaxID=2202825 RepID=A0A2U8WDM0_9HYPH|nr:hypothetical protein [Methylobacterium durans]AWN43631.1 hypothetical protein DK389_27895 [Methylobacterium durans]